MRKHSVLFIDDEVDNLNAYTNILSKDKKTSSENFIYENISDKDEWLNELVLLTATQGEMGVEIVSQKRNANPISVAFIDMRMPPGINGFETIKRIRAIDKDIELVMVTAYSDIEFDQIVNEVGGEEKLLFLKKPFDHQEVKQIVRNLTRKYELERIRDRFVSAVSHELKTPLSCINGYATLLKDDDEITNEEVRDFSSIIYKNANLMNHLVNNLLDAAGMQRGRKVEEPCEIEILSLLNDLREIFHFRSSEDEIDFKIKIPDSFTFVAKHSSLLQALINVVDNGLKFAKQQVTLWTDFSNEKVTFFIVDDGPGIDLEFREHIFNDFFRIENQHHHRPGLGLGLYIVRNVISQHNGRVSVADNNGSGTVFKIEIPRH